MTFDVAFIPAEVPAGKDAVCVVVDVLRASSTIQLFFSKGCETLLLTDRVRDYLDTPRNGRLICAESVEGHRLEGADLGPSLLDLEPCGSMEGKTILMQTTNGTVAVHTLTQRNQKHILIGCMRNASAVMQQAVKIAAANNLGIHVVCAGRDVGTSYTIDDVYCAAYLAKRGEEIARAQGIETVMHDSARLALMSHIVYPGAEEAFADSASGNIMRKSGRPEDIGLCAQIDLSDRVPKLVGETVEGFLCFTRCEADAIK